ncbi:TPA: hypothetical protein PMD70_003450 [Vibrio cholerae]|nr:hypothetical protein [Vibrio cholerae]
MKKITDKHHCNLTRLRTNKQKVMVGDATYMPSPLGKEFGGVSSSGGLALLSNPIGFNGERRDPFTGGYHLGNGYRMYNPRLMRFHVADNMSPFGKGGLNSYAYCLGDPVNQRDPSGHFALLSLLIGAIIGAVAGAAISAVAEGIQCAINPEHTFDWKQVGIGAALGFISGGFGAAAQGAKTSTQVGLAIADALVSGGADFGLNVAAGAPLEQAGLNAGIGAAIGVLTFGIGNVLRPSKFSNNVRVPPTVKLTASQSSTRKNAGVQWHQNSISPDKHLWSTDMITSHRDVAMHPLVNIRRRNSNSDVHIYTGVHGVYTGYNWKNIAQQMWQRRHSLNERAFLNQDAVFQKNSQLYVRNRTVFLHDMASIREDKFKNLLSKPGHHVQAYCYSRNDKYLRNLYGLSSVTSYI